jgi:hypothetical protein
MVTFRRKNHARDPVSIGNPDFAERPDPPATTGWGF